MNFFRRGFFQSFVVYPLGLFVIAAFFSVEKFVFPKAKTIPEGGLLPEIVNLLYENPDVSIVESSPDIHLIKSQTNNTYFHNRFENNFFVNQEFSVNGVKNSFKILHLPRNGRITFKIESRIDHFLKFDSSQNLYDLVRADKKDGNFKNLKIFLNYHPVSMGERMQSELNENSLVFENTGSDVFISGMRLEKDKFAKSANVFFIVIDSLRADALGAYGAKYGVSPMIDEFAANSVYFRNHSVNSSWTRPSTMIFFTGMYPSKTHINFWDYPVFPEEKKAFYNSDIFPLPALFSVKGYESVMIGNNPFVTDHRYLGVDTGFEKVFDFASVENDTIPITEKAISFLEKNKTKDSDRPLFLFLNYNDPHRPYTPPERFLSQVNFPEGEDARKKSYLGEVAFVDSELGRFFTFLKKQGLYDESMIIITSDHGEVMDRAHSISKFSGLYTLFGHGQGLYEEDIQTPLIIKFPNQKSGKKINTAVRSIDIFPTLAEFFHLHSSHIPDGKSLLPVINGTETADREYYGESRGVVALRKNGFKLKQKTYRFHKPGFSWDGKIGGEPFFLYDLKSDPNEHVATQNSQITENFGRALDSFKSKDFFYEFRIARGLEKKGKKLKVFIQSKMGKAIYISGTNSLNPNRILETANGFQLEKIFQDDDVMKFDFKVYPDISPPDILVTLDDRPIARGEFGVGERDVFPGDCRLTNSSCFRLYLAKNGQPDIPQNFRIQIWKNGDNLSFGREKGILENDAMNILRKQGYVK